MEEEREDLFKFGVETVDAVAPPVPLILAI